MGDGPTYDAVGATRPDAATWPPTPPGLRRLETTVELPGRDDWERVCHELLTWAVKTRSGFSVHPTPVGPVVEGTDLVLRARLGPIVVVEPVRVVAVVSRPDRCGFAYGTRPGHPVSGEEAFVLHREPDGRAWLTLRSLTGPAEGPWRWAFPALLVAQRLYRRRYVRALRRTT